ncbi:MAG: hypothetical protein NT013_22275 [Planctomycetia bacterium]|nr:hypothetical protein [Planctomycetia bacterium]
MNFNDKTRSTLLAVAFDCGFTIVASTEGGAGAAMVFGVTGGTGFDS